jgi:hypothetical protein
MERHPREYEPDRNANGVTDDCDNNPNDPNGNEEVSPDCNGNQWPDECDIALGPPWGSLDCNENGIPDECEGTGPPHFVCWRRERER